MNAIILAAIIGLLVSFGIFCALKLFDIGSDFSPMIRKYCTPAASILSLIVVFGVVLPVISNEEYDTAKFVAIASSSTIVIAILYLILNSLLDIKVKTKRKKGKSLPFSRYFIVNLIKSILAGIAVGAGMFNGSICYLTALCVALFVIGEKADAISEHQDLYSRKQLVAEITVGLITIPVVTALTIFVINGCYELAIILLACSCAYLLRYTLHYLRIFVRRRKNG